MNSNVKRSYPGRSLLMRSNAVMGSESEMNEMSRNLNEFQETMRRFIESTRLDQLKSLNLRKETFEFTTVRINEIEKFIDNYKTTRSEELFENDFKDLKESHQNFMGKYVQFCQILNDIFDEVRQVSDIF